MCSQHSSLVRGALTPPPATHSISSADEQTSVMLLTRLCCPVSQVGLKEGALVCPLDGRRFLVKKGIPNLLLDEHEV